MGLEKFRHEHPIEEETKKIIDELKEAKANNTV